MKCPLDIKGNCLDTEQAALLSIGQYTDTKKYFIRLLDEIRRPPHATKLHDYIFSYRIIEDRFLTYGEALATINEMIEKNSAK